MSQKNDNNSSVTSNDTLTSEEGDSQRKKARMFFTDSQHRQLEKAFKKTPYLKTNEKEALASSTGLSPTQIQNWFKNRRLRSQRENQTMTKSSSCSQINQPSPSKEIKRSVSDHGNSKNDYLRQISSLKKELASEKIKSSGLGEQLKSLRSEYDNLIFKKNKIAHELKEGRSTISKLNDKVKMLNNSNESLLKNLNDIAGDIKKVLP